MSVLIGAERIQDKHGRDYRLQIRKQTGRLAECLRNHPLTKCGHERTHKYRFADLNGWSCGHWHATPEDALACAIAKGAPMQ